MSHSHSHGRLPKSAEAADTESFVGTISCSIVLWLTQVMSSQVSAHHVQELEWNFLPSPSWGARGDGSAIALLPPLCQGRGNASLIAKHQCYIKIPVPLSILAFGERGIAKRWSTILIWLWALLFLGVDAFECSCLMFSRPRRGDGWAETSLLIFFASYQ